MSALALLNQDILNTVLGSLTLLFLTDAGDPEKARQAAVDALATYDLHTAEELRLAAEVISFGFSAIKVLAQSTQADLSSSRTVRLRGSAVSLSREAHKSQRKLDQLQRARCSQAPEKPAEPAPQMPGQITPDVARTIADAQRVAKQINARDGGKRWSQAGQKRAMAMRIAEKARQNQASHAAGLNQATPSTPATQQAG